VATYVPEATADALLALSLAHQRAMRAHQIPSNEQVAHVVARGRMHGYVDFDERESHYEDHALASTFKWVKVWPDEEELVDAGVIPWRPTAWSDDQPGPNYRLANVWLSATPCPVEISIHRLNLGLPADNWHLPVLDVDRPRSLLLENDIQTCSPGRILLYHPEAIRWVPSTTPGHHHVYIDYPMAWDPYTLMLMLLVERGVLEEDYAQASIRQGYTTVRKPECPKPSPNLVIDMSGGWTRPGEVYKDPYDED
jgi:hypothetical protein